MRKNHLSFQNRSAMSRGLSTGMKREHRQARRVLIDAMSRGDDLEASRTAIAKPSRDSSAPELQKFKQFQIV